MKRTFTLLPFIIGICMSGPAVQGQDYLVDFTYLGKKTKLELFFLFGQAVDYDVEYYRVHYKTPDVHGLPDTASGLMVFPIVPAGTALPMVVYAHGTTAGPNDVPSRLLGGYQVALAYASKGFVTAAPDFLGLGDARGFHPYIHAASEASACFDMLNATVEYLESHEPDWDVEHLFLAGYSQGGHVSAALHKYLQDYWSFIYPVTASTHMSGPYSISGVMKAKILSDDSYGFPAYIAYVSLGLQEAYGNLYDSLPAFFREPFATSIGEFRNGNIDLDELNALLITQLSASGDTINKRMLQDSVVERMTNDPSYAVNIALADNDLYNWIPETPTRLYYCTGDLQVPYQNAIAADSAMNALGAVDAHAINQGDGLDHGPCVIPSVINSVAYFQSFLGSSSIADLPKNPEAIALLPNPATDYVTVNWEAAAGGVEYQIIDVNGRIIRHANTASNSIAVYDLQAGVYVVVITAGKETRIARLIRS